MVRYAEKGELERVNEIRKSVMEMHSLKRPDIFRADFSKELQEVVYNTWESDNSDVIVGINEGEICGFAFVEYAEKEETPYYLPTKVYYISEFGIDEKNRRNGIGTELINFIKKEATSKKCQRIQLYVLQCNEAALSFYNSLSFETQGRFMEILNP